MAKRKEYLRLVYNVETKPKKSHPSLLITLSNEDLEDVCMPHYDSVVESMVIANFEVCKILVDSGSAINTLFY